MTTPTEYQDFVGKTAIFADNAGVAYTALGMIGEAGEVAEKVKKLIRKSRSTSNDVLLVYMTPEVKEDLVKECGDVLWYISAFLAEIGSDLQTAMDKNVDKLTSRQARGVLEGSGDNR
jgi:NTP pyrophosphatase (non-canonical NTP hydrolase)